MSIARSTIYYWKCDRPAALHGVAGASAETDAGIQNKLPGLLKKAFPGPMSLKPAGGKGNHLTYLLKCGGVTRFIRVEDGPENDGHLDVESRVLGAVAKMNVPVPGVFFTDASRREVPFAVQVIEYFDCADLNSIHREGRLSLPQTAKEIGHAVARWQATPVAGFGPFKPDAPDGRAPLTGYHSSYATYFHLHLDRHLGILKSHQFLSGAETDEIRDAVRDNAGLLEIEKSVLVHKDLALWNIMGTPENIRAFIDWDDAIAGDPTDDLSLLACFHSAETVQAALDGYAEARPLPDRFIERFWLHLLRNMIVKAVIRCEAGYFEQKAGGAFLMAVGQDGSAFRTFTRERLLTAYRGLRASLPITEL